MHLLLRRTERDDGWFASAMMYLIDVRLELSPEEQHSAEKHDLLAQPVYDSEARLAYLEAAYERASYAARPYEKWIWQTDWYEELTDQLSRAWSLLCAYGNEALAGLALHVTFADLVAGQHIECESLEAILIAEGAIRQACELLRLQFAAIATFDGREDLLEL